MGNTHQSQRSRMEADSHHGKWKASGPVRWGYGRELGPDTWWVHFPNCQGHRQSPIDINPEIADFDSDLASYPLRISYPVDCTKVIHNTGHGCQVDIKAKAFTLSEGPLHKLGRFALKQFHFHWGERDDCGSEHTIHNRAYSMEIHFVHWNTDMYRSFDEAAKADNGLAVMAVFVKIDNRTNAGIDYLTQYLRSIRHRGQTQTIDADFDIRHLLPSDTKKYWVYQGSTTTPPCNESVTWIVFFDPISIDPRQLALFRELRSHSCSEHPTQDEFGGHILQNYRPVQPLGSRKISTMEHNYMGRAEFDQQFHKQSLFTTYPEYMCQYHRQGIHD